MMGTRRTRPLKSIPPPRRHEVVRDEHGPIRCMAVADGHVLCRRPGRAPFVLSVREWDAMRESRDADGEAD